MSAILNHLLSHPDCPFTARVIGDDVYLDNVLITCFGGAYDPQDDGSTSSGVSTLDPSIDGVSLPLREPNSHELADSVLPLFPWHIPVEIIIGDTVYTPRLGLIDVGPGLQATHEGGEAHACDLTAFAASKFDPHADPRVLAHTFEARGSVRIIGGAQYVPLHGH